MKELGVTVGFTYGSNPAAISTWDAPYLFGCHCDTIPYTSRGQLLQYHGYDCSLLPCPSGDDVRTTGQVNEIQTVDCTADGGTFTLSFRGQTTITLDWDATESVVQAALQELYTIGNTLSISSI